MNKNVICGNTSCEYYDKEVYEPDNTNCTVHDAQELLDGHCKQFQEVSNE